MCLLSHVLRATYSQSLSFSNYIWLKLNIHSFILHPFLNSTLFSPHVAESSLSNTLIVHLFTSTFYLVRNSIRVPNNS
jgi:hypothetical protein